MWVYNRNKMAVYTPNETLCSSCQARIGLIDFFFFKYFFSALKKNLWEFLNNIPRVLAVFS